MKQKDILIIIILLFIFVAAWVGSSLYRSAVTSTISEDTSKDILPIKATFDNQAVEKLKTRKNINPSFELETVTPTPIVLPTLKAFENATGEAELLMF